jgi:hypothetical protein
MVSSELPKKPGLQVVSEASDGLEAVRKAEELKPDLIPLDIGLVHPVRAKKAIARGIARAVTLSFEGYRWAGILAPWSVRQIRLSLRAAVAPDHHRDATHRPR